MENGDTKELTAEQPQGKTLDHMRYVLGVSLAMVIAVFIAIYIYYL